MLSYYFLNNVFTEYTMAKLVYFKLKIDEPTIKLMIESKNYISCSSCTLVLLGYLPLSCH